MNSVHAFRMILYLLFRTPSVLLCSSREVSSSGLYGRRRIEQSSFFLIINIHSIAAKVRAVELAGKKSCDPNRILAMDTLTWPQRTPKFYSSRAQRAFIGLFRMQKDIVTLFFCAGSNGAALEHNVTEGRFLCKADPRLHQH